MTAYSFVPPFRDLIFWGVPSCVFEKLGCAACGERLRISGVEYASGLPDYTTRTVVCVSLPPRGYSV
jgi:hypothetical protein